MAKKIEIAGNTVFLHALSIPRGLEFIRFFMIFSLRYFDSVQREEERTPQIDLPPGSVFVHAVKRNRSVRKVRAYPELQKISTACVGCDLEPLDKTGGLV